MNNQPPSFPPPNQGPPYGQQPPGNVPPPGYYQRPGQQIPPQRPPYSYQPQGHLPPPPGYYPPPRAPKKWYQMKRVWFPAGGVLLFWMIGVAVGNGEDSSPAGAQPLPVASKGAESAAVETDKAKPQDEPKALGIGDTFNTDEFSYKVNSYQCGIASVGGEYSKEEAKGQFCELGITAENIDDEANRLSFDDFKLAEGDAKYSTDSWINIRGNRDNNSSGFYDELNPGIIAEGNIYFDVPSDIEPSRVVVDDNWLSKPVTVNLK